VEAKDSPISGAGSRELAGEKGRGRRKHPAVGAKQSRRGRRARKNKPPFQK